LVLRISELFAESTVGEGTKFTIKLPIKQTRAQEEERMKYEESCLNSVDAEGAV
jgi:hypothetical protein